MSSTTLSAALPSLQILADSVMSDEGENIPGILSRLDNVTVAAMADDYRETAALLMNIRSPQPLSAAVAAAMAAEEPQSFQNDKDKLIEMQNLYKALMSETKDVFTKKETALVLGAFTRQALDYWRKHEVLGPDLAKNCYSNQLLRSFFGSEDHRRAISKNKKSITYEGFLAQVSGVNANQKFYTIRQAEKELGLAQDTLKLIRKGQYSFTEKDLDEIRNIPKVKKLIEIRKVKAANGLLGKRKPDNRENVTANSPTKKDCAAKRQKIDVGVLIVTAARRSDKDQNTG